MATSNFLLYFAWSRRITRSCSSCSRTGRTRMGLNGTSVACTYDGVPRRTRRKPGEYNTKRDSCLDGRSATPPQWAVPSSGGTTAARVLIVDDDVSVTDTFSRMLRLEGYEVWAALSADEGLALAQS